MKRLLTPIFCLLIYSISFGQAREVAAERELTMGQVSGSSADGTYRYYKPGEQQPFTGVLYARYDNGNYKSRQEFVAGVGQGTWINYWENGNLKEAGTYNQNRVEGPIKKYYPSGVLMAEGTYKEWRVRVGIWKYYNEEGKFLKTENYGQKGDLRDVEELYKKGDISKSWYRKIVKSNQ